jgi:transducin (beta)-like 1
VHSAFTFGQESFVSQSEIRPTDVVPGLLISVLQRGLQYSALEQHINEDGSERKCSKAFNLLQTHVCDEESDDVTVAEQPVTGELVPPAMDTNQQAISTAVDAPIQSSLSNLNLALQNASIMAANAVYGSNTTIPSVSVSSTSASASTGVPSTTTSNKKKKKSTTANTATTSSTASTATTSSNTSTSNTTTTERKEAINVPIKDVDMSGGAVEIKTEEGNSSSQIQFTEEELVELVGHQSEVIGCAWNPQIKNLLASASGDSTVRLWTFPSSSSSSLFQVNPRTVNKNVKVLEHVLIKNSERSSDVTCLEWRRDGTSLATGCYDGKARIWSAQGDLQRTLQKHTGPIFAVRWSANGRFLLTCGIDGLAIIWDVEAGGLRYLLQHHQPQTACLDADWRNETQFATSGSDKSVNFYDMSQAPAEGTGEPFDPSARLTGHTDEVNTVKFDPTGQWLATCSDDSTVRLWNFNDTNPPQSAQVLTAHTKEVYTLKWSPLVDSGVFASASFDGNVILWRIGELKVNNENPSELEGTDNVNSSNSTDNNNNNNNNIVTHMILSKHSQPVYAIAFSPCGQFLASGSLDETLHIWDVNKGTVLRSYSASGHGGIFDLEWRDSSWLAAGNSQGRVLVFEFNYDTEAESETINNAVETNADSNANDNVVINPNEDHELEEGEFIPVKESPNNDNDNTSMID